MFPIRLGTDAEFASLRNALQARDFTEAGIRELRADPVRILVHLFMEGRAVKPSAAAHLPMRELEALGLVSTSSEKILGTVMLYPTRGVYIVSDRDSTMDGSPIDDVVYPANGPNTDIFLDYLPPGPCDAFLDLCAGTGVAAFVAARSCAKHAWAFDITARATHFAEFNRRLNDIPNVTPAQGDLYEPAGAQTFDRIVAHPPYLPVYRPHFVFDSGGQDGERIVRRIIEGLPKYLRPGGRFFALTMGSDRAQPFENRLREWLGEAANEFDIVFVVRRTISPRDYSADAVVKHQGSVEDIAGWRELFKQWGVEALAYGYLVIQRRAAPRSVFTVRRNAGPKTGPAELAWLVDWATAALDTEKLLESKPRARAGVTLQVEHRFEDGGWQPESFRLESEYPFKAVMQAEPWAANLLTLADGTQTVRQLLDQLLGDSVAPEDFARAVGAMISAGLLELDENRLPPH
jgi:SAM-dependent methyltransferase